MITACESVMMIIILIVGVAAVITIIMTVKYIIEKG